MLSTLFALALVAGPGEPDPPRTMQPVLDAIELEAGVSCLDRAQVAGKVVSWLGESEVDARIEVLILGDMDDPNRVHFALRKQDKLAAEREFEFEDSTSCDEKHAVVSVAVALAIDATLVEDEEPEVDPLPLQPVAPVTQPRKPKRAPEKKPDPRPTSNWSVRLGLGAGVSVNTPPTIGGYGSLTAEFGWKDYLDLSVGAVYSGSGPQDAGAGRAVLSLAGGQGLVCGGYRWGRVRPRGCAGLILGRRIRHRSGLRGRPELAGPVARRHPRSRSPSPRLQAGRAGARRGSRRARHPARIRLFGPLRPPYPGSGVPNRGWFRGFSRDHHFAMKESGWLHHGCRENLSPSRGRPFGRGSAVPRTFTFVARFLLRLGARNEDVPDLVQEVFLVAHRRGGFTPGPAKPTTWLAEIAFRVSSDRRKKANRRREDSDSEHVSLAPSSTGDSPGKRAEARQALQRVQEALDTLTPEKRAVFVLYELEGQACDAIAAGMEIPVGTVYSRLHAARREFARAHESLTAEAPKTKAAAKRSKTSSAGGDEAPTPEGAR